MMFLHTCFIAEVNNDPGIQKRHCYMSYGVNENSVVGSLGIRYIVGEGRKRSKGCKWHQFHGLGNRFDFHNVFVNSRWFVGDLESFCEIRLSWFWKWICL